MEARFKLILRAKMAAVAPSTFREWVVAFSPLSKGLAGVLMGGYGEPASPASTAGLGVQLTLALMCCCRPLPPAWCLQ